LIAHVVLPAHAASDPTAREDRTITVRVRPAEARFVRVISQHATACSTADGYIMTLYYAEPGSDTAKKLLELQALVRS